MLKIRLTYGSQRKEESKELIDLIKSHYRILNESRPYKGRGASVYESIYLDIEKETENETNRA